MGIVGFPQGESVTLGFCCFEMEICFGKWQTVLVAAQLPLALRWHIRWQIPTGNTFIVLGAPPPPPEPPGIVSYVSRPQGSALFLSLRSLTFLQGLTFHHL